MIDYIPVKEWIRKEWLDFRMQGIGGSEVGSSIGKSENSSPINIHLNKIGEPATTFSGNRYSETGNEMEPHIARWYQWWDHDVGDFYQTLVAKRAGKPKISSVRRVHCYIVNSKYPWLFASLDRRILRNPKAKRDHMKKGRGILECKNTTTMEKKRYKHGISPDFFFQVYTYLMITEWEYVDIAIHFDGNNLEVVTLFPDKEVFEYIQFHTAEFWKNVEKCREIKKEYKIGSYYGVPDYYHKADQMEGIGLLQSLEPEFVGHTREVKAIKDLIIPTPEYTEEDGSQDLFEIAVNRFKIKNQIKKLTKDCSVLDLKLIRELSGVHVANYDDGAKISYKPNSKGISSIYVSDKLFKDKEDPMQ